MPEKQLSLFKKLTQKRKKGDEAEDKALHFLKKKGLKLIERNFSVKTGEVDLIMKDTETLIFVEVRYRKNADFGGAAASITLKKQQRIIKAALSYCQKHAPQSSMRFDVIAIEGDNMEINWIPNAFDGSAYLSSF